MTPERAAYHALMLRVGLRDTFDREFDEALEQEEPLSDLILDLSSSASDINGTISVLQNFCCDHPPDIDDVYDLVWQDLCARFRSGSLSDLELANLTWTLAEMAEDRWNADWQDFRTLEYHYETLLDGMIREADYLRCRELFLTRRDCTTDSHPAPARKKKTLFQRFLAFFHQ